VIKLSVPTKEAFEEYLMGNEIFVATKIVETIEKNIKTSKRFIPMFEIELVEEGDILDITIDRKNFIETLLTNLKILERHEQYETCGKVLQLINQIQSNI
jgi:Tfp pilus assembly protein PilZ